jgi:hypothetical protein
MYYPLVYILFYIKKSYAVSPSEFGLQVQVNDGISQLHADDHNDEQNQDDVVNSNDQQDMLVNENAIQVNGTNICNQGVPEENVRITNADCSDDNNNANVNHRVQQMNRTVINVDDDNSNADLSYEDEEICAICQERLGKEIELGKMICSCTARFHYTCLVQYTRSHPEYNPFLNNRIKCVTCNGLAAGIERTTRNRHDDDDSNADLSNDDTWALCLQAIRSDADRGYADTDGQCQFLHDYHYNCLMAMCNTNERNRIDMRCAQCKRQIFGILDSER